MLLKEFNIASMLMMRTDVLVIGSGIAGLHCALHVDPAYSVTVVSKKELSSGSTPHSQGGIAAVLSNADSCEAHITDTLTAGDDHCNAAAVEILVRDGAACIRDLLELGVEFDRQDGTFELTREGAHSHRRILHAHGDATGLFIEKGLIKSVRSRKNIQVREHFYIIDLLVQNDICYGAIGFDITARQYILILARMTVTATGGMGNLYRETTNPGENLGDGISFCYRAGCSLVDLEFIQFHPTTLYIAGAPRFLISESVRGEGAYLRNAQKERFMTTYDSRGELASRDIVSKAIHFEMGRTGTANVFLDLTHLDPAMIKHRFPTIRKTCLEYGIDILREYIPVRPSAHYFMGGIQTDLDGRTNITNLLAAGECACTGVHGANRLASNSLLEAAVFSKRTAAIINKNISRIEHIHAGHIALPSYEKKYSKSFNLPDATQSLRSLMWREVGIVRSQERLENALALITYWESYILSRDFNIIPGFELQGMLILGKLIVKSALWRQESRGAHYREDFPEKSETFKKNRLVHSINEDF